MSRERAWEEIVTEATSLREMVVAGNGKDRDLVMSLADGRCLEVEVGDVTVLTDGLVRVDIDGPDDSSLRVRYSGPGLEVRLARIAIYDDSDPAVLAEFREAARKWPLGEDDLDWAAYAEITVASAGTGTGRIPVQSPETI
ncbi:MAG: hypothetical protein JWM19_1284 [Actinomycetia bacterium]|nr:hypothetical protein [Actinomycetes bacterium]